MKPYIKYLNIYLSFIALIFMLIVKISFTNYDSKTNFYIKKNIENSPHFDKIVIEKNGNNFEIDLENYVMGVVAGEMPASFDIEALKAQAVASRTYAVYKLSNINSYIMKTSTSDQVFIDHDEMKKKWGSDFQKYYSKIKKAVQSTNGKVLTYDNKVIQAYFFASSNGKTQDSLSVFGENRNYLKSVNSEYEKNLSKNINYAEFDISEFKNMLDLSCSDLVINNIERFENDYVKNIEICNKNFSGVEFRNILNLKSSSFSIEFLDDIVRIQTCGYGHGVGMSQYGANEFAKNGYTYTEILKHYYTGVDITNLDDV